MTMRRTMLGLAAAAAGLAALPAAAQPIPVGHLMDNSGATSDVGVPYGQGVADTLAWVNNTRNGVAGRQLNVLGFDYGYQAPRAVSQYQAWSRDRVVAIQGWGTADTEALVRFVTRDKIPYISGSYSAALTDAGGKSGRQGVEATPFNFFYGPSYSDALRGMLRWAADDWKARGQQGRPKYVHMGANHPYPNSPKEAGEALARELGFEVLPAIVFALTPGDYTAQCLTLAQPGRQLRLSRQHRRLEHLRAARLPDGGGERAVPRQCLGHGRERHEGGRHRGERRGVPRPHRRRLGRPGRAGHGRRSAQISRVSDPAGTAYRPVHYLAGACAAMLMVEAMETAAEGGGQITGERIRDGFYARQGLGAAGLRGRVQPLHLHRGGPSRHHARLALPRACQRRHQRRERRRADARRHHAPRAGRHRGAGAQARVAGLVAPR